MKPLARCPLLALALALLTSLAALQAGTRSAEAPADKSAYHLFHPVSRELLRDLAPDRPDTTESPITVDAGHFQIESSFFDYGHERRAGVKEEVFTFGAVNLKAGLLNNVDLQFVFDSYTEVRTRESGRTETVEGFSDLQFRLKINLWGNDGGRTAFAFFPFVKVPTGSALSNDYVEGGVILPFAIELNDRFSLGLMFETDFVRDEENGGYEAEFVHTAVLGVGLTDALGAYLEYVGVAGSSHFDYQASLSAGLTFSLSADVPTRRRRARRTQRGGRRLRRLRRNHDALLTPLLSNIPKIKP